MASVSNLSSKINEMLLISRTFGSKSKHSSSKTCLKIDFKRVKLMLNFCSDYTEQENNEEAIGLSSQTTTLLSVANSF